MKNAVPILCIGGLMYYLYQKEKTQAIATANAVAQQAVAPGTSGLGNAMRAMPKVKRTKMGYVKHTDLQGLGTIRPNPPVWPTHPHREMRGIGAYYDGVCPPGGCPVAGLGALGFSFGNLFKTAAKGIEEATINPLQIALRVADAPIKLASGSSWSSVRSGIEAPAIQMVSTAKSAAPSAIMARSGSGSGSAATSSSPTVLPVNAGYIYSDSTGAFISQAQYQGDLANNVTSDVATPVDTSGATTYAYADMNGNAITSTQFNTDVANGILTDIMYPTATASGALAPVQASNLTTSGATSLAPTLRTGGPTKGGKGAAASTSKLPWLLGGGAALVGTFFMFKH